jgi:hypothetical protein
MFSLQYLPKPLNKNETPRQRQQRLVLEEQRDQIQVALYQALEKRRFDDARSLKENLEEIQQEMAKLDF